MTGPASDSRRRQILARLGIGPVWTVRNPADTGVQAFDADTAPLPAGPPIEPVLTADLPGATHPAKVTPQEIGNETVESFLPAALAGMEWPELEKVVASCTACGLCHGRKNTVFGVGDRKASWLFVGEGPGRQEDIQGEPFVGPAGKLLDNMLKALGLQRGDNAFIANIVKCRAAGADGRDRPPSAAEIAACLPFLQRQVELIQPTVIVALGRIAAISLLGLPDDTAVGPLRGKLHNWRGHPLIVTYHPAYLLRQPADKAKVWRDLCMAMTAHAAG